MKKIGEEKLPSPVAIKCVNILCYASETCWQIATVTLLVQVATRKYIMHVMFLFSKDLDRNALMQ